MTQRNRRLVAAMMPATLGLAMLAACNGQGPTGLKKEAVVGSDNIVQVERGLAGIAKNLGLIDADRDVRGDQIQVKGAGGKALAGAEVYVGEHRLVADANGVVTLPADFATRNQVTAIVKAAGHAPMSLDVVPGHAVPLTPLDTKRTALTAAGGGTATNAEGNLEVVFPPGALTGDANVAVTRMFGENGLPGQRLPENMPFKMSNNKDSKDPQSPTDAGYKLADNRPLGTYAYNFDLGPGVEIAPGASVVVKFKAQGRMKELLDMRAAAGDTFADTVESISKDANGDYWLSMQVNGPQAAEGTGAARKLMAAACNTYNDPEAYSVWVKKEWQYLQPGIEVPIWPGGYRTSNSISANWINQYSPTAGGHCVSGATAQQYEHNGWNMQAGSAIPSWITLMTHHGAVNGGRCVYYQFNPEQYECVGNQIVVKDPGYEWQTKYRYWDSRSINALVTWLSDDKRISGVVPNARVNFSHSFTPVRSASLTVDTLGDGYATTLGATGSTGTATASLPSQSGFTYGTSANYSVDCSTVGLNIVKMMPKVNVKGTVKGAWSGGLGVPSNLGTQNLPSLPNSTINPTIDLNSASSQFQINGTYKLGDAWIDAASGSTTIGWNGSVDLATNIWISKEIKAKLVYKSNDNDAALAEDQKPSAGNRWAAKDCTNGTIEFKHDQSAYSGKTRSEALKFENTGSAATWGLNGTGSVINGSRTFGGITLSGSKTDASVTGAEYTIALNATLPSVNFMVDGVVSSGFVMDYKLRDANGAVTTRSMRLPAATGGVITVSIPIEEKLGEPLTHTLEVVHIMTDDFVNVLKPANGGAYPSLAGLRRGTAYDYPVTLKSNLVAPK